MLPLPDPPLLEPLLEPPPLEPLALELLLVPELPPVPELPLVPELLLVPELPELPLAVAPLPPLPASSPEAGLGVVDPQANAAMAAAAIHP
jgi:hypothetical protein